MRALALLLVAMLSTVASAQAVRPRSSGGATTSAPSYYVPTVDLPNSDARLRSLSLVGPADGVRSGHGFITFRQGATGLRWLSPYGNVLLYSPDGRSLQVDSPFNVLALKAYWVDLPAQSLTTCNGTNTPVGREVNYQPASGWTRKCRCSTNGTIYAWVNADTGTVGTTTTCDP